jgi:hypothetical protein
VFRVQGSEVQGSEAQGYRFRAHVEFDPINLEL